MYELLIKGGTIVTATDTYVADVAVKDGKIVLIGSGLAGDAATVIDAGGKYVLPGGIDVHTHLDMPFGGTVSSDDFETGTKAAAHGGTTTVVDFAIQGKGQTLTETAAAWQRKAEGRAVIDYGLHLAVTDATDSVLEEMAVMIAQGYSSFKLFMTYDGMRVNDDVLMKALIKTKEHGGLVCVHAENYYVIDYLVKKFLSEGKTDPPYHARSRPVLAEAEATGRAVKLAKLVNAPLYIVHLSCQEALAEVEQARGAGYPIMAETCPQYLLLSEDNYQEPDFQGAKYVMSPPLRPRSNQSVLWQALAQGKLQVVATDHCPFFFKGQKEMGRESFAKIPNGAPGIEARLVLMHEYGTGQGKFSIQKFVEITATNPAKIFGLYPEKGTIAIGSDADVVIFDPKEERTITKDMLHENVDYTPYQGFKVKGFPITTIANGQIVVDHGHFMGRPGAGRFIKRKTPIII